MKLAQPLFRRSACAALIAVLSACGGGGQDGASPPPDSPAPPAKFEALAVSIGGTVPGNPVEVRASSSANGDAFVLWLTEGGTRRDLWAARYDGATGTWSEPVNVDGSDNDVRPGVAVNADALGNAMVVWHDATQGDYRSRRFDRTTGGWAAPLTIGPPLDGNGAAGDASGVVLAGGYAFDPARGTWAPAGQVIELTTGTGDIFGPAVALDGTGNGLALFSAERQGPSFLASNYFSRSTGRWDEHGPDGSGAGPGGTEFDNYPRELRVAGIAQNRFLGAWQMVSGGPATVEIRVSRFVGATRTWTLPQTLVPASAEAPVSLERLASGGFNSFLVWTAHERDRTTLRALRVDDDGVSCSDVSTIDSALGGGAARADIAVDEQGYAVAAWQQFEAGRADDGSRSNIAFSRFDGNGWQAATLAENELGAVSAPSVSAGGGRALLAWIQADGDTNRVKVLVQPLPGAAAP